MSTPERLERLFVAARRELAPPVDVVGRVLSRLPRQTAVAVPEVEVSDWIAAGVSTLVAACALWLVVPLWNSNWSTAMNVWHPLSAMVSPHAE